MLLALKNPVRVSFRTVSGGRNFFRASWSRTCFFILLIVGVLGLYTEFTHPGMIAPGVIGGICMVLALYAMHILPVNFAGCVLDSAGAGVFYSGSEVHKPRSAGGRAALWRCCWARCC